MRMAENGSISVQQVWLGELLLLADLVVSNFEFRCNSVAIHGFILSPTSRRKLPSGLNVTDTTSAYTDCSNR